MSEKFMPIKGYEGLYEVSDVGNVKSLDYRKNGKPALLKPILANTGYFYVQLYKSKKRDPRNIHILVLENFISDDHKGLVCRHLNGDKKDNRVENLKWGTYKDNADDARKHGTIPMGESRYGAKLTNKQAECIRNEYKRGGFTQLGLAKKYSVGRRCVQRIVHGLSYRG